MVNIAIISLAETWQCSWPLPSNINFLPVIKMFHFTSRSLKQQSRWFSWLSSFICSIFSIWTAEGEKKKRKQCVLQDSQQCQMPLQHVDITAYTKEQNYDIFCTKVLKSVHLLTWQYYTSEQVWAPILEFQQWVETQKTEILPRIFQCL